MAEQVPDFFPEHWLKSGVDPKKLSKQVIDNDRWDREDLARMLKEVPPFSAARKELEEFAPTGDKAMNDTFWTFLKAEPELIEGERVQPSHLVDRRVMEMMMELDEWQRLRRYSVNDDVQAALSAGVMEPDLETLFDKTEKQREKAQELEQKLKELFDALKGQQNLDEMVEKWKAENPEPEEGEGDGDDGDGDGDGQAEADARAQQAQDWADQQAAMQAAIDAIMEGAVAAGEAFSESMEKGQGTVRSILKDALTKAADEAQHTSETARSWGMDPGEMQRLPSKERMELAKRLNNERFKRIADLFGPMRNMMLSEQQRKTVHTKEELYDVEIGNDLGRVLPTEILNLRPGPTRLDFLRRFSENKLLQYAMQGTEKLSRGGIIMCEDGSGSMHGEREMWAKAVMLCLLHLSRIQKRPFHLIHFGGPNTYKLMSFINPEDYRLENILDAAELFFGGGTWFETPMGVSLDLLRKEHAANGSVRGDVVFVTDDECAVTEPFMKEYLEESERMQFTTWGISVSGAQRRKGALDDMSQGKVATIKDFLSGDDIRHIFRGV